MRVERAFQNPVVCVLLLRHTGHSRQHALRMMMVMMPVMEVQRTHRIFRVASLQEEVNLVGVPAPKFTALPHHSCDRVARWIQ